MTERRSKRRRPGERRTRLPVDCRATELASRFAHPSTMVSVQGPPAPHATGAEDWLGPAGVVRGGPPANSARHRPLEMAELVASAIEGRARSMVEVLWSVPRADLEGTIMSGMIDPLATQIDHQGLAGELPAKARTEGWITFGPVGW